MTDAFAGLTWATNIPIDVESYYASVMSVRPDSKRIRIGIVFLSVAVLLFVTVVLVFLPDGRSANQPGVLPTINATFNVGAASFLVLGWLLIRNGRERAHQKSMLTAFGFSVAFFLGYVIHHWRVGSVPFEGQGVMRIVYFSILVPHILLAAILVPMALLTVYRGLRQSREAHRRLARWTLPIWLFVSVSGVVVYAMLYNP